VLHGVPVVDDYRWLADGKDPQVQAWSDGQNARARAFLDALPGRQLIGPRVADLMTRRPPYLAGLTWLPGPHLFALRFDPATKQQPDLVTLASLAPGAAQVTVLDLMRFDPSGGTAIDWYVPSPDGRLVAVALSRGGSEDGTLHLFDTATGAEVGERIPRVQEGTGGGGLAWSADGKGFFYTRYPRAGERPAGELDFWQKVHFHALGTPEAADAQVLGDDFPRIAETALLRSEDGRHHLATVANGDGGEFAVYLRSPAGSWTRVAAFEDGVVHAQFGRDGGLWLLSKKGAPRRQLLRLPLDHPVLAEARVVLPEQAGVLEEVVPTASRLYVSELLGGPTRLRVFGLDGRELAVSVPAPPVSTNAGLERLEGDDLFFVSVSFVAPPRGLMLRAGSGALEVTAVNTIPPLADFSDAEVRVETAVSKDGARIPMYILQRKGTRLDGTNPVLLTGYGGYGVNTQPSYRDTAHVLLEQGVVQVRTALRGGGEFGDAWHLAGNLVNKQRVFDDFIACAERLVALGYTTPARLAIEGGSNGGLLMGAALTQRPELFRAVVSHVGIYDMIQVESEPNGAYNVTEFGTVKDPAQFKALYGYSPYHHVRDGVAYPAILFLTGANDPRVDPAHSRKMTARLQAANPAGRPVLLRTSGNTGHGMGSPVRERIAQAVDVDLFLLQALGVTLAPPQASAAH
jgi:prolyl oligopeptidase